MFAVRNSKGLVVALVLAVVGAPDEVAASPATRGLVPEPGEVHRQGVALGVALGPTTVFELGDLVDINGTGVGPSFRIGTSASETLQWWLQIDGAGFLFSTAEDEVVTNQMGLVIVAGQVYLRRAVWLKGGLGIGNYRQKIRRQAKLDPPDNFGGPAALAGVGFDLLQRGSLALGLELTTSAIRTGQGTMIAVSSGLFLHVF